MKITVDNKQIAVNHRDILFSFLDDGRLTSIEREVGVVLILMCEQWRGFVKKKVNLEKVYRLCIVHPHEVSDAVKRLVETGWLTLTPNTDGSNGCAIPHARLEEIATRQRAYRKNIGAGVKEKAAAEGTSEGAAA